MSERNVLLKNVKHPFLVGLHFSFQTADKLYFVLDYINGGEVSKEHTESGRGGREGGKSPKIILLQNPVCPKDWSATCAKQSRGVSLYPLLKGISGVELFDSVSLACQHLIAGSGQSFTRLFPTIVLFSHA